jgi:hypothetical protein
MGGPSATADRCDVLLVLIVAGCTPIPRVELGAYTTAYSDVQAVTNGLLDIVAPYERIVMPRTSQSTTQRISIPARAEPRTAPSPSLLLCPLLPRQGLTAIDPSLFRDPAAARAAAEAANRPITAPPASGPPGPPLLSWEGRRRRSIQACLPIRKRQGQQRQRLTCRSWRHRVRSQGE